MGDLASKAKQAILKAKQEVAEEALEEGIKQLKKKLVELGEAETVVANIQREIEDLEEAIEQGNV